MLYHHHGAIFEHHGHIASKTSFAPSRAAKWSAVNLRVRVRIRVRATCNEGEHCFGAQLQRSARLKEIANEWATPLLSLTTHAGPPPAAVVFLDPRRSLWIGAGGVGCVLVPVDACWFQLMPAGSR